MVEFRAKIRKSIPPFQGEGQGHESPRHAAGGFFAYCCPPPGLRR